MDEIEFSGMRENGESEIRLWTNSPIPNVTWRTAIEIIPCSINLTKLGHEIIWLEKKKKKESFDHTYISFANFVADWRLIRFTLQIAIPGKIFLYIYNLDYKLSKVGTNK